MNSPIPAGQGQYNRYRPRIELTELPSSCPADQESPRRSPSEGHERTPKSHGFSQGAVTQQPGGRVSHEVRVATHCPTAMTSWPTHSPQPHLHLPGMATEADEEFASDR